MDAREKEKRLIDRCVDVMKHESAALSLDEASAFHVAAKLMCGVSQLGASRLESSARSYFMSSKETPLDCIAMINARLIVGLPRFRDMLEFEYRRRKDHVL